MSNEKWVSGYHGKDSMRDKARKLLGPELRHPGKMPPESASSPGHTKMRRYAGGGFSENPLAYILKLSGGGRLLAEGGEMRKGGRSHRKCHKAAGGTIYEREMRGEHPVRKAKFSQGGESKFGVGGFALTRLGVPGANNLPFAEGGAMRKGGYRPPHKKHGLNHGQTDEHYPTYKKSPKFHDMSSHEAESLRRGGKAHKHKKDCYGFGGETIGATPYQSHTGPQPMQSPGVSPMRRGGKSHRKHHASGGASAYAYGGNVYEREMVGEKPSRKAHHFGYESEMRGEHAVRKPSQRVMSKKGLDDENHGQMFKRGGHGNKKHKADGGFMIPGGARAEGPSQEQRSQMIRNFDHGMERQRAMQTMQNAGAPGMTRGGNPHKHRKHLADGGSYAAGGVGKIRHNQATAAGMPKPSNKIIRRG